MIHEPKPQYVMTITVWHGPDFGHSVEMQTVLKNRKGDTHDHLGSWRGLGVPEKVLEGILASVHAVLEEHLVTRYGVAADLWSTQGGEPDPF